MEAFHDFYHNLYSKVGKEPSPDIIDSFLGSVKIPKIREQHREELEAPISTEEVAQVIKNLKSNLPQGPDGICVPYYKHFLPNTRNHT